LEDALVFSDLEQMKGYEFNVVVILNCRQGVLPPEGSPPDEYFRHGCRLYVAMTRARDELYLSYSGIPTSWLNQASRALSFMTWDEVVELKSEFVCAGPELLRQSESENADNVMNLKGRDFLFTPQARGLSLEAIRKIDELVDGTGLIRNRERVRWKNMATLFEDLRARHPRARQVLGPVVNDEIRDRLALVHQTEVARPGLR
jgi:hypothetical protein